MNEPMCEESEHVWTEARLEQGKEGCVCGRYPDFRAYFSDFTRVTDEAATVVLSQDHTMDEVGDMVMRQLLKENFGGIFGSNFSVSWGRSIVQGYVDGITDRITLVSGDAGEGE